MVLRVIAFVLKHLYTCTHLQLDSDHLSYESAVSRDDPAPIYKEQGLATWKRIHGE